MSEPLAAAPFEPQGQKRRWLAVALAISVAFNLFALGFVAARALHPHHGREGRNGPFLGPRGLMREGFGPKARPALEQVMERHGGDLRKARGELRRARRQVRDALLSEPFDAAELERALSALRGQTEAAQARMHEALIELAGSLPLEQRKHLARRALAFESYAMGDAPPHKAERKADR